MFYNRVKFTTATAGTGSVTVGAASSGYQTPAQSGMVDGETTRYVIEDGTAWETGLATASSTATVIARTLENSSTGSLLNLSGSATMYFAPTALDLNARIGRDIALTLGAFVS